MEHSVGLSQPRSSSLSRSCEVPTPLAKVDRTVRRQGKSSPIAADLPLPLQVCFLSAAPDPGLCIKLFSPLFRFTWSQNARGSPPSDEGAPPRFRVASRGSRFAWRWTLISGLFSSTTKFSFWSTTSAQAPVLLCTLGSEMLGGAGGGEVYLRQL